MKNSFKNLRNLRNLQVLVPLMIGSILLLLSFGGCGEDSPTDSGYEVSELEVTEIILSPKSPAPKDTVLATVVIESPTPNPGEFPTIKWAASGGTFMESNQLSVRWIAPETSGIYEISVTASNSVSSSNKSINVFAGESTDIVSEQAGELHVTATGDSIYFLTSSLGPGSENFHGFMVSLYIRGSGVTPITTQEPGFGYAFSPDLTYAAHTVETILGGAVVKNPIDIFLDDLVSGSQIQITTDRRRITDLQHYQHTEPAFSPDGNLLAYQALRPYPFPGITDTFDVAVYNLTSSAETFVTETHGIDRRNFHPSFSSDGNWLVFFSNRTGIVQWELYGLPVVGGTVLPDSSNTVRLTFTGGTMARPDLIPASPRKTWNPNPMLSTLAIVDANGQLHFVVPDPLTDITAILPDKPVEMAWSPNGEHLAVALKSAVYIIDYALASPGSPQLRVEARAGDGIDAIAWSRDSAFLIFRATRGDNTWNEFLDVSGMTGLTSSVIVTPFTPKGNVDDYASLMWTWPQWGAGGEVFSLYFDAATPRMTSADLSGAMR